MFFDSDFYRVIIDLFNWSSYNWKPKLVIVFIHNFPTSSIISDDISETNDWKDLSYSDKIHNYSSISN